MRGALIQFLQARDIGHKSETVQAHSLKPTQAEYSRAKVDKFVIGDRVGVPWLGWTCDQCRYCQSGRENLCDKARFTGYQIDGGYAELTVANQRYCFLLDDHYSDLDAAPLL